MVINVRIKRQTFNITGVNGKNQLMTNTNLESEMKILGFLHLFLSK